MNKNQKRKFIGSLAAAALVVATVGAFNVNNTEYANADVNAEAFEMLDGASIRLAQDKNGLRFKTVIGSETYNDIVNRAAGTDVRVGAYIVPADYVNNANAYKEGAQVGEYNKFKQYKEVCFYDSTNDQIENKIYQDGDYYYTNAVLTNVLFENLGKEFVGIGYMAWTTSEGTVYEFVDLGEADVVRSAAYVASAHYVNETDETKQEYVKQYVYGALFEKTGVVTFDEQSKTYTVYGSDTYTKVDDVMAAIGGQFDVVVDKTTVEADVNAVVDVTASAQLTYNEEKNGATVATVGGVKLAIACTSSSDKVVVQANGTIKAVSGGEATLTFSCMGKTATCNVEVVQRAFRTLAMVDLDLSKDSAAVINVDAGEVASKVYLGEQDVTSFVTATAGQVAIAKEAFASAPKGDNQLTILTTHYEYDAYVCKVDFAISDQAEFNAFRAAAKAASDQSQAQLAATNEMALTYSDTWDWYVVIDADITFTGTYSDRVSYFGILEGRGHYLKGITVDETHKWQRCGFFDNRIVNGDQGVTDSQGVMHEGVGIRVRNLAIIDISATRGGFMRTITVGSKFENIYYSGSVALVDNYLYSAKTGFFNNIVTATTITYFPMSSDVSQTWTNIEGASRMKSLGSNIPSAYACENFGGNAANFYNGVKTAITTEGDSWNKRVWGVDANGNITFGGNVVIAAV